MGTLDMDANSPPRPSSVPTEAVPRTNQEAAPRTNQSWPAVDRRGGGDRRERPTFPWASLIAPKRRMRGRRHGEAQNSFVDVYRKRDVALLVSILVLNILDALLTLIHIQRGGREANPAMERLLSDGDYGGFLFQKCAVVGSLLVILVIHKNFMIARRAMWAILAGYLGLFAYHVALQTCGTYSGG